jgi:hypothetical protein
LKAALETPRVLAERKTGLKPVMLKRHISFVTSAVAAAGALNTDGAHCDARRRFGCLGQLTDSPDADGHARANTIHNARFERPQDPREEIHRVKKPKDQG